MFQLNSGSGAQSEPAEGFLAGLFGPRQPPYDPLEWEAAPFAKRALMSCRSWALEGFSAPLGIYLVYALKVVAYVLAWMFWCTFTEPTASGSLWMSPVSFQKAIVWSMLFEVLGLGCGSGPLSGRYVPPVGGFLYFLRRGTTKLPLLPGLPVIGGIRRGVLDVVLYAALLVFALLALVNPQPGLQEFLPLVILVPVLGIFDKTLFLAARSEHYWVTIVCFVLADNWIAAAMAVQLAIWFFAGVSKLNHHFPYVVCVMASNSPFTPWASMRRRLYRNYPTDLNPSGVAVMHAVLGTLLELSVPIVLLTAVLTGSAATLVAGLTLMVILHLYITSNVPMGVPIEWNVMVVYGGFFLFWGHPDITPLQAGSWPIGLFLFFTMVCVPVIGNLWPHRVSFLLSMRYYAGNWATSVWLLRKGSHMKLEDNLVKSSPWLQEQIGGLYEPEVAIGMLSRGMAFRLMHLHGRALVSQVQAAVGDMLEEYDWMDGEIMAGLVLGYNFGDGHLHNEGLLQAVQQQCGFDEGELRCIFVESQPLGRGHMDFRVHDAKTGQLSQGRMQINDLRRLQAWPE